MAWILWAKSKKAWSPDKDKAALEANLRLLSVVSPWASLSGMSFDGDIEAVGQSAVFSAGSPWEDELFEGEGIAGRDWDIY